MTLSRMAVLGAVVSTTALLAGQGSAQISPLTGPQLATQPPKLERIVGANRDCTATEVIYSETGGYGGSADVFDGQAALILQGTKLNTLTSISVQLSDGRTLAPTSRSDCPAASGKTAVRVTFTLPGAASASGLKLQLSAPKPPPLVQAPAGPVQTCVDRLTGQPTACPDLPSAPTTGSVSVANIVLNLKARPAITGVSPNRIDGPGRDCLGRVVFSGTNLAGAAVTTNTPATFNPTIRITGRTATTITADIGRRCEVGSTIDPDYFAAMSVRRGANAESKLVGRCDTCADVSNTSFFSGVSVKFVGTSR